VMDWQYLSAASADGEYQGARWLAPYRAAGFLVAMRPAHQPEA
jgi:hypothetical protein